MKNIKIIFHVDMDSFYSSVETAVDTKLKGLPVVVGSDPMNGEGRGVVSTCSYEAREYGIHSAMPISKAYRLCPNAVYLRVNMPLYKKVSANIMDILRSYSSKFQQVSVDEAYLDVTDLVSDFDAAADLALKIKEEVHLKEGITCSIGLAPNKSIAKIASDYQKPDGLTVVRPEDVRSFLFPLDVSRISGVGKKTSSLLNGIGIRTIGDLAGYDVQALRERFGKFGLVMHQLANGLDDRSVMERGDVKSISKEDTFDRDTSDMDLVENVIDTLSENVHTSLLKKKYLFKTVTIKVRLEDFTTYTRAKTLGAYSSDLSAIKRTSKILLQEFRGRGKLRLVGVGVTKLDKMDEKQTRLTDFF
ncbi:DNA polymerase IV [Methanococcoides methylutens]|uniref:DNA polymerase IV n=1 Tax=Methanococcoides methylutens TaxID=2226 RepID=A0A099T624_METMT|nr:DNA polymerase IV [Methanococcoides methylutens]KGK99588.1 DNA polymerase IV [Methanococcoides methylutens]